MERFEYKVKDKQGKTIRGVVEAPNKERAAEILHERGFLVIYLRIKKDSLLSFFWGVLFKKVSLAERVNFTRQLATMVSSGLKITEALQVLENQFSGPMKRIVGEICRDIEGGQSLASSLEKHPQAFNRVYVALVRAGELGGVLENVLERLADNLESQKEFRGKMKAAMVYPAVVTLGMIGVVTIMIVFVIPKMMTIYEEFQAQLPFSTRVLLGLSGFIIRFWWLILGIIGGLVFFLRFIFKNPDFRRQYDKALLRLPIFGNLIQKSILTEFTRTLSLLIGTGTLIIDALKILEDSVGSIVYKEAIRQVSVRVEKGLPLTSAMVETAVFPPVLSQMIAVGEETGKLDEVLERVSNYFQQESEAAVKGLTSAMELFIIILLGIGVAFLMISVIMPIYNLTSQF